MLGRWSWGIQAISVLLAAVALAAKAPVPVPVHGERILLGDVIPGVRSDLAPLDLGPSPEPTKRRMLFASEILRRLAEAHIDARGIAIPPQVEVVRPGQVVNEVQLTTLIKEALQRLAPDMRIKHVTPPGGVVVDAGSLQVRVHEADKRRSGRQTFRVTLLVDERPVRTLPVTVESESTAGPTEALIERGAAVTIVVTLNGIVVRNKAVAQQAGARGQSIAVLPDGGSKVVRARVRDGDTVEVEL